MKKRFLMLSITVLLSTLLLLPGCGGEKSPGEAAGKGEVNLLSMLPANAVGVFSMNMKKMIQQDFFANMVKEMEAEEAKKPAKPGELFPSYKDFVTKTGIDAQKDIHGMAIALYGDVKKPDVLGVLCVNYDKNTILAMIKEKAAEITEEDYNGIGIFMTKDDKGKDMGFSFVNDKIIAGGSPTSLKKMIDLHQGKGDSILKDAKMKGYLKKIKPGVMASFVFGLPAEVKKVHQTPMAKMDLTKAEALTGYLDYASNAWQLDVAMICQNEEGNKQLVTTLNGLKMMGAAAGPEVAELVNQITLSATADSVKLAVSIPDELVKKLETKFKEKAKATAPAAASGEPTGEEQN